MIEFKYYLHEDSEGYEREQFLKNQDPRFTDELLEKMGSPFYEVMLLCQVDEETGQVTIVGAHN
jgi:hypothetical protein